jgi:hypothetical protein
VRDAARNHHPDRPDLVDEVEQRLRIVGRDVRAPCWSDARR